MKHYHIDVVVTEEDLATIENEFRGYMESAEGFTVSIVPDKNVAPSPELEAVIRKMFYNLLITVGCRNFRIVN